MSLTRRDLMKLGVAAAACSRPLLSQQPNPAVSAHPLFPQVPASESGITFVHESAMSPERYLPETMGPGVAFLDFDNDGWMDIYLVNTGPSDFYKPTKPLRNALYKNNRDGSFTDVTEKAGVAGGNFGMGVAVADFDNDGWPDMFITGYGRSILYKNNRDGTFSDITTKAGLDIPDWTTSAVWFDYDNDGRLDLFVCRFVDYSSTHRFGCGSNKFGKHFYCIPKVFNGSTSLLFHNNGDGTFTDVSKGSVIGASVGKGLGVIATDINNDGRMDLFVANDTVQNYLYVSRGPGPHGRWKWDEVALAAEVGFSENGKARSGMGVDAEDL